MPEGGPTQGSIDHKDVEKLTKAEYLALLQLETFVPPLLEQLREDINHGRIGAVIGVDAGGRIPALSMSKAVKALQEKRGFRGLKTRFLRGRISDSKIARQSLPAAIEKMQLSKDKKILVVDDTYFTGSSTSTIVSALEDAGYEVVLAVFMSLDPDKMRASYPTSIYATNEVSVNAYKRASISGVRKEAHSPSVHASVTHRLKSEGEKQQDIGKVPAARKIISAVTARVVSSYEEKQ